MSGSNDLVQVEISITHFQQLSQYVMMYFKCYNNCDKVLSKQNDLLVSIGYGIDELQGFASFFKKVECWDIKKVGTTKGQGCEETHRSHMIHSLPAQDNSVDLLICANLSTYKLSQINEEILRMLKPSGCVAITAYQVGDRPSVRKKEKPVKMVVKTYLPKQVVEKRIYLPPGNFLSFYFDVRSVIPCSNCPLLPEETSRKDYWAMNTSRIYKFSSLIYTIDSNFCHVEEDESPSQTSDASIKPQRYPICKNNIASIDTLVFLVSPKYSRTLL